jgi:lipopolysaccharide export system permease protein
MRIFLVNWGTAFLIISAIIFMFDSIELIKIFKNRDIGFEIIFNMALMKNLYTSQRVAPFIIMIASMLTYLQLNRTSEIVAIKAAGISIWSILLPGVISAFLLGCFSVGVLNPITTTLLLKYEKAEAYYLKGQTSLLFDFSRSGIWLRQLEDDGGRSIIHALRISQENKKLHDVSIFYLDENNRFTHRITADAARLNEGEMVIKNAIKIDRTNKLTKEKTLALPTKLSFRQIQESVIPPKAISFWDLPSFIAVTQESGFPALQHQQFFYSMLMAPFFYIAMMLVGSLFTIFHRPRHGVSYRTTFLGIATGFFTYFASDLISAMGGAGRIPLVLSTVAPTILCSAIALLVILHVEESR